MNRSDRRNWGNRPNVTGFGFGSTGNAEKKNNEKTVAGLHAASSTLMGAIGED